MLDKYSANWIWIVELSKTRSKLGNAKTCYNSVCLTSNWALLPQWSVGQVCMHAHICNLPPAFVCAHTTWLNPSFLTRSIPAPTKRIFVRTMEILKYKPKKAYEITIFNFEIFLPLGLLEPVGLLSKQGLAKIQLWSVIENLWVKGNLLKKK